MTTKAYCYIRFSTIEQMKGDSLRRQITLSEEYAKDNELELDTSLDTHDLGVTAYKGANLGEKRGLGRFIDALDRGEVSKGSFLLIESLDRLSRQREPEAMELFLSILRKGIIIVTTSDMKKYSYKDIKSVDLIVSLTIMSRAHEESKTKGERIAAAWEEKRKNAHTKKLTKWSPKWVSLSEDRTEFVVDEERKKLVEKIFEWSANGLGTSLIIREIDELGIKPWDMGQGIALKNADEARNRVASKWHISYIHRLLKNRAVLGELVLKTKNDSKARIVKNYYPPIITEALFYRVRKARESRNVNKGGKGAGRKGSYVSNLFSGIAYCGYSTGSFSLIHKCSGNDESMVYVNKGNNLNYLQCSRVRNGNIGCEQCRKLWRYDSFEESFLEHISDIDISVLLGSESTQISKIKSVRDELESVEGRLLNQRKMIKSLKNSIDQYAQDDKILPTSIFEKANEYEDEEHKLLEKIEVLKSDIAAIETENRQHTDNQEQMTNVINEMQNKTGKELFDFRLGLSELFKKTINRIEIYGSGSVKDETFYRKIQDNLGEEALKLIHEEEKLSAKAIDPFFTISYKSGELRFVGINPKKPIKLPTSIKWDAEFQTIEPNF